MNLDNVILFSWRSLNKNLKISENKIRSQTSREGYKTAIGEFILRPFNTVKIIISIFGVLEF